jgi:hypothetical protein
MPDPPSRRARTVILWLWASTILVWVLVYAFFLAPHATGPWYMHAVDLLGGAALTAVIFLNLLRGRSAFDLSERQQTWRVAYKFWVMLAFLALAPLSIKLAGTVAIAMIFGSFIYVHFVREN